MVMSKNNYFRKRAEQDQLKLLAPLEKLAEKKKVTYEKVFLNIQKDIDVFVKRFAVNNGVLNYHEVLKLLNSSELKEFRMTLEEYIKIAKDKELSKKYIKELENVSLKVRITRLQALQLNILHRIENLYNDLETEMTEQFKTLIYENQNRLYYNLSTQYENLFTFSKFSDELVDKLLKVGWSADGKNFSDRLWLNKRKLIHTLNTELKTAIIRGQANNSSTFKRIHELVGSSYKAVRRLVLTESAYFSELAKKEVYKELDLTEYEVIGTLDSISCDICGQHDGEVWEFSKYEVGITAPIYHPNCRCTTAPYFRDEDFTERYARDKNGKGVTVPSNMSYDEWKKLYIK